MDAQSLLHVFSNGATAAGTVLSHGFQVSLDKACFLHKCAVIGCLSHVQELHVNGPLCQVHMTHAAVIPALRELIDNANALTI